MNVLLEEKHHFGWEEGENGKYKVMEGDWTAGDEHTVEYTNVIL